MGGFQAMDLASGADGFLPNRADQLSLHLRSNHYPPLPTSLVTTCEEAIDLALQDDWETEVALPDDIRTRTGQTSMTVADVIEAFHLDPWLIVEVADEDE